MGITRLYYRPLSTGVNNANENILAIFLFYNHFLLEQLGTIRNLEYKYKLKYEAYQLSPACPVYSKHLTNLYCKSHNLAKIINTTLQPHNSI